MLQDNVYGDIVSWGPGGECFIIKVRISLDTTHIRRICRIAHSILGHDRVHKVDPPTII